MRFNRPGKTQKPDATASGERGSVRGHFVRGHFKQRKHGIWWWGDFFRGDPAHTVEKAYQVGQKTR